MFGWRSDIIADPTLVEHYKEEPYFLDVFSILPERQYFHTLKLYHIFELYWLLREREVIDNRMWEGWSRNVQILVCTRKNREIWAKLKKGGIFNPDFVTFVDSLIQESDARSVGEP